MVVVAILTATMISMDTGLNTIVAILIKDIYPKLSRYFKWEAKEEKQLWNIGRLYTWFLGFMMILLALNFDSNQNLINYEGVFSESKWISILKDKAGKLIKTTSYTQPN